MKSIIRLMMANTALLITFLSPVYSQIQQNLEIVKIKENFYRLTSKVPYNANILAYVCKEGILLVDAGQKQTGSELKKILNTIADGNNNVKILINTHAHIDHTGGNFALAGEPVIIGPDILRMTLRDYSYVLYEFPDNALPSVTFKDSMNIYFGDEKIRIISVPGSHDATDVIVHFTKSGIVCVGDIYEGMTIPTIDSYTGNLLKYPDVIDKILTMIPENVTIISGHEKESTVKDLKKSRDMIFNAIKIVKEEMTKGKDISSMKKDDVLKDWASFEGGFGGDRNDWIESLAIAGPSNRGSIAGELYKVLIHSNSDTAIIRYKELKRDHSTEYLFEEGLVIRTGNWLLDKDRIEDAIKLMKFCVSEFPNSAYSFCYLADVYLKAGNKTLAIKNYEKSLQINPKFKYVEKKLIELRKI